MPDIQTKPPYATELMEFSLNASLSISVLGTPYGITLEAEYVAKEDCLAINQCRLDSLMPLLKEKMKASLEKANWNFDKYPNPVCITYLFGVKAYMTEFGFFPKLADSVPPITNILVK